MEDIEAFIKRFPDLNTIIVNGGDPLMMPVKYYLDIIDLLDKYESHANLSFTTNLWGFYKKPSMWVELFNHPRVGITTSFQFGNSRLKGDLTPYTEAEFVECSDLMLELVGYRPSFITVITAENADTVMKTVELAKRLGVEAKINHASASGPETTYKGIVMGSVNNLFTQADIYEKYVEIYDAGLMEFEYNTKQMARRLSKGNTTCPLSRTCDSTIRSLQPSKRYFSCGGFGDDNQYPIDFDKEMGGEFFTPLTKVPELQSMKESCAACPMFAICNGCKKTVSDTKRLGLVEYHCEKMKRLAPRIIEINGLTGLVETTPYVNESIILKV